MRNDGDFNHGGRGGHGDKAATTREPQISQIGADERRRGERVKVSEIMVDRDGIYSERREMGDDEDSVSVRVLEVLVSSPFRWLLLLAGGLAIGVAVYLRVSR